MSSTREIEARIRKFSEIGKIILSMKSLASLTVQQAQQKIEQIRNYEQHIQAALHDLLPSLPEQRARTGHRELVLVFGSDQGLCGLFNASLARKLAETQSAERDVLLIGHRLADLVPGTKRQVLSSPSDLNSIYAHTSELLGLLSQQFEEDRYHKVELLYNHFTGLGSYQSLVVPLLPLNLQSNASDSPPHLHPRSQPLMDVAVEEIFAQILQEFLYMEIYRAFLESLLSENGVRLVNMNQASRNIDKRIQELEMESNFVRQNEVTDELSEIIAAYGVIIEAS